MKTVLSYLLFFCGFIGLLSFIPIQGGSGIVDLNALHNYANQSIPGYITRDNTPIDNPIMDTGATLGRVLFYDKALSSDYTISCGSCHRQEFAFGDTAVVSPGVNGSAARHTMRLVNARFGDEEKFFWDERANSLEEQTTMPIQDHVEMGFSGEFGDPDMDSLITRLETIDYYQTLFEFVYGDGQISEERLQKALAQFIRSIQSFDSKYDIGRIFTGNSTDDFNNFSVEENLGKTLFLTDPVFDVNSNRIAGGAGCGSCHREPEYDIDPNSGNNGAVQEIGGGNSFDVTRAPSLKDAVGIGGVSNGPFLHHGGNFLTPGNLMNVINHYNNVPTPLGIDERLAPNGIGQNLQLTQQEKNQLVAFIKTFTGNTIYSDEKWSDPFDEEGNLTVIPEVITSAMEIEPSFKVYPNPASEILSVQHTPLSKMKFRLLNMKGEIMKTGIPDFSSKTVITVDDLESGIYLLEIIPTKGQTFVQRIVIN